MLAKLTPEKQTEFIKEDAKGYLAGEKGRPHYGMMTHILLLSKRLDALEKEKASG